MKPFYLASSIGLCFLLACSSGPPLPPGVSPDEIDGVSRETIQSFVVMGLNDFHGAILPTRLRTKDPIPVDYEMGGVAVLASHIKHLRRQYDESFLLLDAGDQWQGSLNSHLAKGAPTVEFFNDVGLDAAVLGAHDFDFGSEELSKRLREAAFPYLATNLRPKPGSRFEGNSSKKEKCSPPFISHLGTIRSPNRHPRSRFPPSPKNNGVPGTSVRMEL